MIYLSPLRRFTECEFRIVYTKHFRGIDCALSPFIPLTSGEKINISQLKDVLPENNRSLPLIPQILGNDTDKFIRMCKCLHDFGYEEVNWNLGCPKRQIVNKKRGSGILPYPEMVKDILEKVIPAIPNKLSVKMRLGYESPDEIFSLTEIFNNYPISKLFIHPRVGKQIYEGEVFLDKFEEVLTQIRHPVVYNGDIKDLVSFRYLQKRFPQINDWMIGRGILTHPLLPSLIKGTHKPENQEYLNLFKNFHSELYLRICEKCRQDISVLGIMKAYWAYFSRLFKNSESIFRKISTGQNLKEFLETINRVFMEEELTDFREHTNHPVKLIH